MSGRDIRPALLGTLGLVLLAGCSHFTDIREGVLAAKDTPKRLEMINGIYKVGPPDLLTITVRDNKDLDTEVMVRPDGNITFPLLGDVYVDGLTPEEIAKKLDTDLANYVKDVETTVTVTGFNSKKVFLFGEVERPGPQMFTGNMTLVEAVAGAGSVTRKSAPGRVRLVRGDPEAPKVFKINLKDITMRGETEGNLQLKDGDIVFVPKNAWAIVGDSLDDLLYPFRSVLGLTYNVVVIEAYTSNR